MRLLVVCAGIVLMLQQQQSQKSSIEGAVLRAGTNEPIAGAQVALTRVPPTGSLQSAAPATTDSAGKFILKELEPGAYRLLVTRDGYARQEYGARQAGQTGAGTILALSAAQPVKDIIVRLTPTGSVNGRVVGPAGEPLMGMEVQVLRPAYDSNGGRTLLMAGSAQTDDRGEYRLYWITPGRYYISAGPSTRFGAPPPISANTSSKTYASTYYPNAPDANAAIAIDVLPGVDVNGIDIAPRRVQTYRVRGRVIDVVLGRAPERGQVSLAIVPRQSSSLTGMNFSTAPYSPDGTFELRNVAPGQYWIRAQLSLPAPLPGGPIPPSLAALVGVEVGAEDVDDLLVIFRPAATVSGRVTVDGQAASAPVGIRPTIRLTPPVAGSLVVVPPAAAQPNPDGTFLQENVTPAEYRLSVSGLPSNFYVKEARFGAINALTQLLSISDSVVESLNIVVSPNAGQVDGAVTDDRQQPASGILVVMIPNQRDRRDLYKSATTDAGGRFTIRGITPGNYKVFAWDGLDAFAYFDPDIVQKFESKGKPVHITESSKESLNLPILQAGAQ